jgi:hypothetical protein
MGEFQPEIEARETSSHGCLAQLFSLLVWSTILLPIGILTGVIGGELHSNYRRFSDERRTIAPVLAADPSLSGIELMMYTGDGSAYLVGQVKTNDDKERLRIRMLRLFGETRIEDLMHAVGVRKN